MKRSLLLVASLSFGLMCGMSAYGSNKVVTISSADIKAKSSLPAQNWSLSNDGSSIKVQNGSASTINVSISVTSGYPVIISTCGSLSDVSVDVGDSAYCPVGSGSTVSWKMEDTTASYAASSGTYQVILPDSAN